MLVKLKNGNRIRSADIRSILVRGMPDENGDPDSYFVVMIGHGDSYMTPETELCNFGTGEEARAYADEIGQLADAAMLEDANRSRVGGDLKSVALIAAAIVARGGPQYSQDIEKYAWEIFEKIKGYKKG